MEANQALDTHVLEIPVAGNGSATWTIRARSVQHLVDELVAAEDAVGKIARLAGRIVAVTCGVPAAGDGGRP